MRVTNIAAVERTAADSMIIFSLSFIVFAFVFVYFHNDVYHYENECQRFHQMKSLAILTAKTIARRTRKSIPSPKKNV